MRDRPFSCACTALFLALPMLHQQTGVFLWRYLDVFEESSLGLVTRDVHDADGGEARLVEVRGKGASPCVG